MSCHSSLAISHQNPERWRMSLAHSNKGSGLGWTRRGSRALEWGKWDFCQRHGRDSKFRNGRTTQSCSTVMAYGKKDTDGAEITALCGRGHRQATAQCPDRVQEAPAPHTTGSHTHASWGAGGEGGCVLFVQLAFKTTLADGRKLCNQS